MRWLNEDKWNTEIQSAAARFGVPADLVRAIIGAESAYSPQAMRREVKIGDASAGLMQILLSTARGEGYGGEMGSPERLTGLFDPATNIFYGTLFLSGLLHRTNKDIPAAVSAYNGGYRPSLGFGSKATRSLTLCLARDSAGKCIYSRNVKAGEFGNQPYVDKVMGYYLYFQGKHRAPILTVPQATGMRPPPPLNHAHHVTILGESESKNGGRDSGSDSRTLWTQIRETIRRLVSWAA